MLRRFSGLALIVSLAGVVAAGCKKDPTAASAGAPVALQADFSSVNVKAGSAASVTAWAVDALQNRTETAVTFAACDAKVTVTADTSFHPVPPTSGRASVKGVTAGNSCVTVSGGGLTSISVTVVVS